MKMSFYTTGELNDSSYVKNPLRWNALLNLKNDDKNCFICSILADLHPCDINPNRVSKYRHYFNELNLQDFDFIIGFNFSDMHLFENLNNLSINIYKLYFYKDDKKCKYELNPNRKRQKRNR